ncbi:MAG: NAD(P)/FAD-dependent oxidoreductase [Thermomicrobiales bacterium]
MPPPSGSYDVIMVGGGLIGCSIAYQLARRKKRVILLEQRDICSGASGRNGGMTGEGSSLFADAGDAVYALTSVNLRMMETIGHEIGVDFQLRRPGSLDIATTKEQWDHLREASVAQQQAGLDVELLDPNETRKLQPALTPDILGAKFARGHGHLWPFHLVHGLANAALKHGAEILTGTTVQRLTRSGNAVTGVESTAGMFQAEHVVLATNAYTPLLLTELPAGAIVPARGQILVTQPVAPMLNHSFGTNFDKEYGRQVPGGPILCGGYRRLDESEGLGHYEERTTLPVLAGIARCLTQLYPSLGSVQVVRCWSGIMGFTADGVPLIGPMESLPGLFIAAGFNGGGFSWGLVVGQIVAATLLDDHVSFDLSPFRPERFGETGTAWSNPFTAGEQSRQTASPEA